jgi:hypothetical protein
MRNPGGSLLLAVLLLSSCDSLFEQTPERRQAEEARAAARWFSPVPAMNFEQATIDAWVESFARHAGNCRAAWLDAQASPRLDHSTLLTALVAHAKSRPDEVNERHAETRIFVGARDRMQPLLTVHRRRVFDAQADAAIDATRMPAWRAAAAGIDIQIYRVSLSMRYTGDLAALQRTLVEHWGGTPTLWPEVHDAWSHARYAGGAWTLFVPDSGMHELQAHDPSAPDAGVDNEAARERWLDAATAAGVEMPRMPAGQLPLIDLHCSYAVREDSP